MSSLKPSLTTGRLSLTLLELLRRLSLPPPLLRKSGVSHLTLKKAGAGPSKNDETRLCDLGLTRRSAAKDLGAVIKYGKNMSNRPLQIGVTEGIARLLRLAPLPLSKTDKANIILANAFPTAFFGCEITLLGQNHFKAVRSAVVNVMLRRHRRASPERAKSSSVASAGVRKPSSGIALRGVCSRGCGLGSSLQVEVAHDERGGLAVRLVQGQRLVPLQVAHNLLEARALIEAVGPKRLHLFMGYCAATSPAARSTPLRSARA